MDILYGSSTPRKGNYHAYDSLFIYIYIGFVGTTTTFLCLFFFFFLVPVGVKKMGSENPTQIPFIDFCSDPEALEPGSERWSQLCREVRAAGEKYGCFELAYDGVPAHLRDEMFAAMKRLFDLPLETKLKNYSPKTYRGYIGQSAVVPLYESLGVEDAPNLDAARAFTDLMWPEGNPRFW